MKFLFWPASASASVHAHARGTVRGQRPTNWVPLFFFSLSLSLSFFDFTGRPSQKKKKSSSCSSVKHETRPMRPEAHHPSRTAAAAVTVLSIIFFSHLIRHRMGGWRKKRVVLAAERCRLIDTCHLTHERSRVTVSAKFISKDQESHHEITKKIRRLHRCGFATMLTTWINYTIKCLHSIPLRDF